VVDRKEKSMQPTFTQTIYLGPALAGNHTPIFKAPFDMQLLRVSAVNTSANAGKLDIGSSADDDLYLDNQDFGVSSTPVEFGQASFVGGQYPHIPAGTIIKITITDHASHMAGVTVMLTYSEG
jgi:hypothetical protein